MNIQLYVSKIKLFERYYQITFNTNQTPYNYIKYINYIFELFREYCRIPKYIVENNININLKLNNILEFDENSINDNILVNDIKKYYEEYNILESNDIFKNIDKLDFEKKTCHHTTDKEFIKLEIIHYYNRHNEVKHIPIIVFEQTLNNGIKHNKKEISEKIDKIIYNISNANSYEVKQSISDFCKNFIKKWSKDRDILKMIKEFEEFNESIKDFYYFLDDEFYDLNINFINKFIEGSQKMNLMNLKYSFLDPSNKFCIIDYIQELKKDKIIEYLSSCMTLIDINKKVTNIGFTPFLFACSFCDISIIKVLILYGGSLDTVDNFGYGVKDYILNGHKIFGIKKSETSNKSELENFINELK